MQSGPGPRPFDVTSGFLIELDARAWLEWLGLPSGGTVRSIESDVATVLAEVDKVLRVDDPSPWLAHFELQASRDTKLPQRMLQYHALLINRHELPVESAVILLREQADSPAMTGRFEQLGALGNLTVAFHYRVVRVWEHPADEFLTGGLSVAPLASLADLSITDLPHVLRRLDERFTRETDPSTAHDLRTATAMLLGLRYHDEEIGRMVHRMSWIEESSVYQAAVRRGQEQGRSIGLLEGREEGRELGRAEGRVEGEALATRRLVLRLGASRFGPPPPSVTQVIESTADVRVLEGMVDRMFVASSWDEVLERPSAS